MKGVGKHLHIYLLHRELMQVYYRLPNKCLLWLYFARLNTWMEKGTLSNPYTQKQKGKKWSDQGIALPWLN